MLRVSLNIGGAPNAFLLHVDAEALGVRVAVPNMRPRLIGAAKL